MRLVAIALLMLVSACAAPATIEGVFSGEPFAMQADSPLATPNASGRDIVVVIAEAEGETLRTVNVELRDIARLPLGKPVQVGRGGLDDRRPMLDVIVGALVVETRADGTELWTTAGATKAVSQDGWIMLEDDAGESVAGSFEVDLDDGGYVQGSFVAPVK